jgi:1-acyl-sn-glycerol-3-phosphate acyltransferase
MIKHISVFKYTFMRGFIRFCYTFMLGRISVTGKENIPPEGERYIVVTNHNSVSDSSLLMLAFPSRRWRFFASRKWGERPFFGHMMNIVGAIYVTEGEADRKALKEATEAIQLGDGFGLAPEGHRSKTGSMMKGMDGAAYLANRTNAILLPVGITETDKLYYNLRRLKITTAGIKIGKPFRLPDMGRRVRARDLPQMTELIMAHIAAELPESYRGVYADSPALGALLAGEDPWAVLQDIEAMEETQVPERI